MSQIVELVCKVTSQGLEMCVEFLSLGVWGKVFGVGSMALGREE